MMNNAPTGAGSPDAESHDVLHFGPFAFEPSRSRLRRDGVEVHVTPKAAQVLGYLLERPGELIPKDEFLAALWEDVHVREESLTQAICAVRCAIGDRPQSPRFIQTVSGTGYRFIGEVSGAHRAEQSARGFLGKLRHARFWALWSVAAGLALGVVADLCP